MLEIGTLVDGKYKILNVIGKGGMSVVYLAMNERANKQWAIKEFRKDGVQNYEVVKQGLIVETNLLKQLRHPNLPSIVDVIEDEDTFLIVMDYIEGIPLSRLLEEEGKQPQSKVVNWAIQLCSVLQYLHNRENPIIYRDMKPSNIMLRPDGSVILIDFGTARTFKKTSVEDTTCLGTIGYAAPEQFGGKGQTDPRTDIYCLGATLYHLITGQNPSDPPYEMYPITTWDPTLSTGLESIIWQCTQANPKDRFQSCDELMFALQHYHAFDIEVKKKRKKKIMTFGAFLGMGILMGVLALGTNFKYHSALSNNYDCLLQDAALEKSEQNIQEKYAQAISIKPGKAETYMLLLQDDIMKDSVLTENEAYTIRDVLSAKSKGNKTNEEYFSKNKEKYEEFSYQLGVAYYFAYEDKENKTLAKKWLDTATKAKTLDEKQKERAKLLLKITDYYLKIGVESKSGDASVGYDEYFKDLMQLKDSYDPAKDDKKEIQIMSGELKYQISKSKDLFIQNGITEEEINEVLAE